MKNLKDYIVAANHSTDIWLMKNHIEIYDEVLEYCKDIKDISYKQKLWHYQNQVSNLVLCANNDCNNLVKFKGRWTLGYYKYCCQKCSVNDVEAKKALLNYSRVSKTTKEDKILILDHKENNKIERQLKLDNNKKLKLDKIEYFNNISIENYIELTKNPNGLYVRDYYVKEHMHHIFTFINNYNNVECEYDEKVYMYTNTLIERPKCKCGTELTYKNKTKGYGLYCSVNCATIFEKEKATNTMFLNTGFTHHSMLEHNIEKRIDNKINYIKNHINNSNIIIDYNKKSDVFNIKCDKCNEIHETHNRILCQRISINNDWRDCITISQSVSNPEIQLRDYIESIYSGTIESSNRSILYGKEIDIYLPELKIGIEYNGIYWHNSKFKDINYHHNKWKCALSQNVKLIQIYGDEWEYKQNIIKNRLKNLICKSHNKIYAKNCIIKQVKFNEVNEFLKENHLYGSVNSSINYGLYHNNKLVYLMCFSKPRKGIKHKTNTSYELLRFCNKLDYLIIGGLNRLFNHFINNNININEVYSISPLEWTDDAYSKINMKLKSITKYSYWYIKNNIRVNKNDLKTLKYDILKPTNKIYGAGHKIYVWTRQ